MINLPAQVKGIIFDFDGTLFDISGIALHIIADNPFAAIRIWKERLVRTNFAGRDFLTADNYYRAFFAELGKKCHIPAERVRTWYFNHYMPGMVRVLRKFYKPRPGLNDLLLSMDTPNCSLKTAVYSDYPVLNERMKALGLPPMKHIRSYGPDSFGAQKPAARPFLQIAKDLGLQPEEVLVIGDREETDGLGAFNSGMHFFFLETGRKRQRPTPIMYAGKWEEILNSLKERIKTINQQ